MQSFLLKVCVGMRVEVNWRLEFLDNCSVRAHELCWKGTIRSYVHQPCGKYSIVCEYDYSSSTNIGGDDDRDEEKCDTSKNSSSMKRRRGKKALKGEKSFEGPFPPDGDILGPGCAARILRLAVMNPALSNVAKVPNAVSTGAVAFRLAVENDTKEWSKVILASSEYRVSVDDVRTTRVADFRLVAFETATLAIVGVLAVQLPGWINFLACMPEFQRLGLGSFLLAIGFEWMHVMGCSTARLTPLDYRATAFWQKKGFTFEGAYITDTDESVMQRLVPHGALGEKHLWDYLPEAKIDVPAKAADDSATPTTDRSTTMTVHCMTDILARAAEEIGESDKDDEDRNGGSPSELMTTPSERASVPVESSRKRCRSPSMTIVMEA